tara:strand:- start:604 stop:825 length:222 start_codon:yes stop_codon:yes gene_type:complete
MEPQQLINAAFAGSMAVIGWFARELWSAVKKMQEDIANLPKEYVGRDDYRADIRELKEMLSKIFDKLDSKVDK